MDPRLAAHLDLARMSDEGLVEYLYRLVLRRKPDAQARERARAKLAEGTLSRATFLQELVESVEFERVRALDDAVAFARWARAARDRPRELRGAPGSDERVIEIPWVLSRYRGEPRVLDVGYAFAEAAYLAALLAAAPGDGALVGVDLAEADVPGLQSVVADVRRLPFPSRSFDVAICISTLEHVGRDTSVYGVTGEEGGGMEEALRELRRVLARGGRLLVTVPCGEPEEQAGLVQKDQRGWLELFRAGGFLVFEHEVYELGTEGWRSRPSFDPAGIRYGDRGPGASAVLCAELHPARLGPRLRAVARSLRSRGRG